MDEVLRHKANGFTAFKMRTGMDWTKAGMTIPKFVKLVEKVRVGGKIHRKYDEPRTPFQRVMESGQISETAGKRLQARYEALNVVVLHKRIEELRDRLFAATEAKNSPEPTGARRRGRGIGVIGAKQRLAQQRRCTDSQ